VSTSEDVGKDKGSNAKRNIGSKILNHSEEQQKLLSIAVLWDVTLYSAQEDCFLLA
jgi:hypothetical protein